VLVNKEDAVRKTLESFRVVPKVSRRNAGRPQPDVLRPGPDQLVNFVLLDRVSDPTGGATKSKEGHAALLNEFSTHSHPKFAGIRVCTFSF